MVCCVAKDETGRHTITVNQGIISPQSLVSAMCCLTALESEEPFGVFIPILSHYTRSFSTSPCLADPGLLPPPQVAGQSGVARVCFVVLSTCVPKATTNVFTWSC